MSTCFVEEEVSFKFECICCGVTLFGDCRKAWIQKTMKQYPIYNNNENRTMELLARVHDWYLFDNEAYCPFCISTGEDGVGILDRILKEDSLCRRIAV